MDSLHDKMGQGRKSLHLLLKQIHQPTIVVAFTKQPSSLNASFFCSCLLSLTNQANTMKQGETHIPVVISKSPLVKTACSMAEASSPNKWLVSWLITNLQPLPKETTSYLNLSSFFPSSPHFFLFPSFPLFPQPSISSSHAN